MRRILRVFFWVLLIAALLTAVFHFEEGRDAFALSRQREGLHSVESLSGGGSRLFAKKTYLGCNAISSKQYCLLSQKDLIEITYCVLGDGEMCSYTFYIEKGGTAEDITLYLGGAAVAYGWYGDLSLTQAFDFSLALTEDVTLYAQKSLLFEGEGNALQPILIKTADELELLEKISNAKFFCEVFNVNGQSYENLAEIFSTFSYLLTSDMNAQGLAPLFNGANLPFGGSFDGGNNTLSLSGSFSGGCGLFGGVSGCIIKNLFLEIDFTLLEGSACYGGTVAALSLENVHIENVTASGSIKTNNASAITGGFIGMGKGSLSIANCLSYIELNTVSNAGGFLGYFNPPASLQSSLDIRFCTFSGKITISKEKEKNIGGFVGQIGNGASSVSFNGCVNEGTFDFAPEVSCVGGLVGCYTSILASKINVRDCVNKADFICVKGNRVGGLLGFIRCREIEIKNCANFGEISCLNVSDEKNSCGGLLGYVETPCQSIKICDSINYGEIKTERYGGAFCGYVNVSGAIATVINCINAAQVNSALTPDRLLNKAGTDALFSGCVNLESGEESLASANKLESVAYQTEEGLQEKAVVCPLWKYLYDSYVSLPRQIYLNFTFPLESVEIFRYRYVYDDALNAKVLIFAERTEAAFEGKRINFTAAEELSLYIIKTVSQGEEDFCYYFLEITPLYCDFAIHLYQNGDSATRFTKEQEVYSHNYWQDEGKLYSFCIENLEEGRDYEIAAALNGEPLCANAQGIYEFYIEEGALVTVKVSCEGVLVKSINLIFEIDYTLPCGLGTLENPLLIGSEQELINYMTYTDGGRREGGGSVYFLLTQDIDFEGKTWRSLENFYGVFDGGGYALKNFLLASSDENKAAFITNLYGTIKNVNFENVNCQTDELYGSILCIYFYGGGKAENIVFSDCSVDGGRDSFGLGVLAARAVGEGDIYIEGCAFYNCFVEGYLNASCAVSIIEEKINLYISNIDAQNCAVVSQSQNAAILAACVNGFLSVRNCVIKNCSVDADACASAVAAFFQNGELFAQDISIENCKISAQYAAGGVAARIEGRCARIEKVSVNSCVITEKSFLSYDGGGAGGIVGYSASPVIIERCCVAQSVIFTSSLYGAAGGIAGVLKGAAEISLCINAARVISQGVFGDAAGIAAYSACGISIENCANLGLIESPKGRGGGMVSKASGGVYISNSYNLEKITAKKADALVAQADGDITLFNVFYFENCAPCAFEGALAFDGNCSVVNEVLALSLFDLLYAHCGEWETKEGFTFPLLKDFSFNYEDTVGENLITAREKENLALLDSIIIKDKTAQNLQILFKGVSAQQTYIIDFSMPFDCIAVYQRGNFIGNLDGGSCELSPLSGNDSYFLVGYSGGSVIFTVSVAFDLPFEYQIDSCGDLLIYLQGKQKEGHFDYGLIDLRGKYFLRRDIDLASCDSWTPLGDALNPFCGIIDGGGYEIQNLKITGDDYAGFLGYAKDAVIKDLHLSAVCVKGENYVGGISGYALNCAIENCSVSGTVRSGGSYAGVILGYCGSSTTVSGCFAGKEDSPAFLFASSRKSAYIGGIAGYGGKFYDCMSYAVVRSQSVNCVGGLVGEAGGCALFENCFFAGEIYYDALDAQTLPRVGYLIGYAKGEVSVTNCGVIVKLSCDCALDIDKIEIFNAPMYCERASLPDGEGNIEVVYRVIFGGYGEGFLFERSNYGGITARIKMKGGVYKFICSIDKKLNILKTGVAVECGALTSYVDREEFLTVVNEGSIIAVEVENANDFEYIAWAINGAIPLTLKTEEGLIVDYSPLEVISLGIKLAADIDLTVPRCAAISKGKVELCQENAPGAFPLNKKDGENFIYDFYGLGYSIFAPYGGSIFGQGHSLKVEIDMPFSFAAGVIAFGFSGQNEVCVKDLALLGNIKGGRYVGLIGFFSGGETSLPISGVTVKARFEGLCAASLLGGAFAKSGLTLNIKDCVTDASFNSQNAAAFAGENLSRQGGFVLCFSGINKDYTLLNYASHSQTLTEGEVLRTIKVCYGTGQNEYVEIYTADANASSVTINSITAEGVKYSFKPLTLVFKKENIFTKAFYLFILKGELSKTYDGNSLFVLTEKNYLGSWDITSNRVYADNANAAKDKDLISSCFAVEGAPVIICAQDFKINIDKAPLEISFGAASPLVYNAFNHELAVDICGAALPPSHYSLVYYLMEGEELTELSDLPLNAARYRVLFLLHNDNYFVAGQDYFDFEICKREIQISFPQNYDKTKTWGSGDPLWKTLTFEASFGSFSESIEICFFRQEGEDAGFYNIFAFSKNGNYDADLASAAYFEIVKAAPRLFFANTQTIYNNKHANFTAFIEGVEGKAGPQGKVNYFYYLDEDLTIPTTLSLAGAVAEGGAPLFAGKYFVRAEYQGDKNYISLYIVAEVEVKQALPNFSCPQAESIYAGQSLFDSGFLGGSGEGTFFWKENILFGCGGEFSAWAVFSPLDQRNYQCVEFEASVDVIQLTVTFKDAIKSLSIDVLYGQNLNKQDYLPFPKLGYEVKWEDVCTQNITKPLVVNALYTLVAPTLYVEGQKEVIYGKILTLTAVANHPLGNISYAWYEEGSDEIISDSPTLALSDLSRSGVYTVVVSVFDDGKCAATQMSVQVNIKRAHLSVEAYSYNGEYDGQSHGITLDLPQGACVLYSLDGVVWREETLRFKDTCDAEVFFKVTKENYHDFYGSTFVKIKKRRVTVTIDDKRSDYLSPLLPLTYKVTQGSVLKGEELNVLLTRKEGFNAGAYAISGVCLNDNGNYQVHINGGVYVITPVDLSLEIDFCDTLKEYDGSLQNLFAKGLPDFLRAEYYCDSSCTKSFNGAAEKGAYNVYVKIFSPDGNYLIEGKEFLTLCAKLTIAVRVELKWEVAPELIYSGKDLRCLVKAYFEDEKGNLTDAWLTFTKDGDECPFVNAGSYVLYASLEEFYISSSPLSRKVEIKTANIDLSGVCFNDLAVDFDGGVKKIEIFGVLPESVFVEYFCNGKPFFGAVEEGEYLITARFFAEENYLPFEMTARLTINRNLEKEQNFSLAVNKLGKISLFDYDRLKELCKIYDEIIYKEGVKEAKEKLDAALSAYDKLAERANGRKEESQTLLEKHFLPSLKAVKVFAATFGLLILVLVKKDEYLDDEGGLRVSLEIKRKKKKAVIVIICVFLATFLSLSPCAESKLSFAGLVKALQNSNQPCLVEADVSYSESGLILTNAFTLEITKTKEGYAAKYAWENKEAAPFGSGEQFVCSSGSGYFTEGDYNSLSKQLGQSKQTFQSIGACRFEIKSSYFLSFEFCQEEGEESYYFYGELNGTGRKAVLGEIEGEISRAFIRIEVLKKEQKVTKIVLSYQYSGGGEAKIVLAYGYTLQEIEEENYARAGLGFLIYLRRS